MRIDGFARCSGGFRGFGAIVIGLLLLAAPAPVAWAESLSVQTRSGVTVDVDLRVPENAKALVILMEGGNGRGRPGTAGFASKAEPLFVRNGLAAALLDAPSDKRAYKDGMPPEYRNSKAQILDLDAVVAALRQRTRLPVWILGISWGSQSALHYASLRSDRIDGVVALSSVTEHSRGRSIADMGLDGVAVPLLVGANQDDSCEHTPPAAAEKIAAAAIHSPAAVVRMFRGGRSVGPDPCGVKTHHTYFGIEDKVVSAVAQFIAAQVH